MTKQKGSEVARRPTLEEQTRRSERLFAKREIHHKIKKTAYEKKEGKLYQN